MNEASETFWAELERYHHIQEAWDRHMEIVHPNHFTSDRWVPKWFSWDDDYASNVIYYEYRGPNL